MTYAASSGDSYTDVGFNITTGPYPNPSNYEGNPDPPGKSSAYALNWAQEISAEYNKSLIYLYDFAPSGAIVNSSLISPYQSVNNTFTAQVDNQFLPYLTGEDRIANWHSSDSLFTIFFGINDIDRALGGDYPCKNGRFRRGHGDQSNGLQLELLGASERVLVDQLATSNLDSASLPGEIGA
ncbi:hypothetical protein D0863_02910 [Hortaea werneckii]|uniref:Carbohydrate esterase family 16 protein n=1 Tax=Hortaea werneckii TaxID=91943 RepID=A0A3M7EFS6_HORWE|nr:hypothetical protein D0863_02910 [Hortaea werneckii]